MSGQSERAFNLSPRDEDVDERPVQTAATWAPKVIGLDGEYVVYTAEAQTKKQGTGLLAEFIALADGSAETILRFGKKWGALHINGEWAGLKMETAAFPHLQSAERIDTWQHLSRSFRAILHIGAKLNAGSQGDGTNAADWTILGYNDSMAIRRSQKEERLALMSVIRRLVSLAKLQPRLYWNSTTKDWQIDLDSTARSNLLAVLTIQLMIQVANKEGYAICSVCRRAYPVGKRPTPGRRSYCDDPNCQRAKWTRYKREQRARRTGGDSK